MSLAARERGAETDGAAPVAWARAAFLMAAYAGAVVHVFLTVTYRYARAGQVPGAVAAGLVGAALATGIGVVVPRWLARGTRRWPLVVGGLASLAALLLAGAGALLLWFAVTVYRDGFLMGSGRGDVRALYQASAIAALLLTSGILVGLSVWAPLPRAPAAEGPAAGWGASLGELRDAWAGTVLVGGYGLAGLVQGLGVALLVWPGTPVLRAGLETFLGALGLTMGTTAAAVLLLWWGPGRPPFLQAHWRRAVRLHLALVVLVLARVAWLTPLGVAVLTGDPGLIRDIARWSLGDLERRVDHLEGLLADGDAAVRERAVRAVGVGTRPGSGEGVRRLCASLADADPAVRIAVAEVLSTWGSEAWPAARDPLVKALEAERSPPVAWRLIRALGDVGLDRDSHAGVALLVRLLRHDDDGVRSNAASTLGDVYGVGAGTHAELLECLLDPVENVRRAAAYALRDQRVRVPARYRVAYVLERLDRMDDPLPEELYAEVQAEAGLSRQQLAAVLDEALADPRPDLRAMAWKVGIKARALVPRITEALVARLDHEDERPQVLRGLVQILWGEGDPPPARGPPRSPSFPRGSAAFGIPEVPDPLPALLVGTRKRREVRDLLRCVYVLGLADRPALARYLAGLVAGGAPDSPVRDEAAALLGWLQVASPEVIETLEAACKDQDRDLREAAEVALRRLRTGS